MPTRPAGEGCNCSISAPSSRSLMCGFRFLSCALPGEQCWRMPSTALKRPAWPDGASPWPTLALDALTTVRVLLQEPTAQSEPDSVGSPKAVPVPWASTTPVPDSASPANATADRSKLHWAEPFGAVRLALRPSCRTATPPIGRPSLPRDSTAQPMPSLRT